MMPWIVSVQMVLYFGYFAKIWETLLFELKVYTSYTLYLNFKCTNPNMKSLQTDDYSTVL